MLNASRVNITPQHNVLPSTFQIRSKAYEAFQSHLSTSLNNIFSPIMQFSEQIIHHTFVSNTSYCKLNWSANPNIMINAYRNMHYVCNAYYDMHLMYVISLRLHSSNAKGNTVNNFILVIKRGMITGHRKSVLCIAGS